MAQAQTQTAPAPRKPAAPKAIPIFKWEGKNKQGETKSGEMEASDDAAVKARLTQMGIQPTKVKKKAKEFHIRIPGIGGASPEELLVLTRLFLVVLDAGPPQGRARAIFPSQSANPPLK